MARALPDATPLRRARRGPPTLRVERRLFRHGVTVLGAMDEVGRGSPAGPAYVGVVVIDPTTTRAPAGVRDSKLLTPTAREGLVPAILGWARDSAVGAAGAADVDRLGVTGALRLAGYRALAQLEVVPDLVLLDGAHDWLTVPDGAQERDLRRTDARPDARPDDDARPDPRGPPVVTRVKADLTCASVAAASILAKVARDAVMAGLARECPGYGWDTNMGYGTPDHLDALRRLGPTRHHRLSWRLPDRV